MADTQRTRAALLALQADNVTGQMSLQDLRDFSVTVMEEEFANPGDFWKQPDVRLLTTDKTGKGWKDYSQVAGSDWSFGNLLHKTLDGIWVRADAANSLLNPVHGVALDSQTSNDSTCQILRRGVIYDSSLSATFSGFIGRPLYLDSGVPGSLSTGKPTSSELIVGFVEGSDGLNSAIGKWRFDPTDWGPKGV